MIKKKPVYPDRVRRIPTQFSWVDHRLVSDHYIEELSPSAAALYLFLITVSDAQGLSYYGEATIAKRLSMTCRQLTDARQELVSGSLVAYQEPIYQVLPLGRPLLPAKVDRTTGGFQSLKEIFKQIA